MKLPQYITTKKEKGIARFNEFATFRKNLFILRSSLAMSGEKLSSELDIAPKRILDFETGRMPPSFDELRLIAKYFNVSMDDIMYKNAIVRFE